MYQVEFRDNQNNILEIAGVVVDNYILSEKLPVGITEKRAQRCSVLDHFQRKNRSASLEKKMVWRLLDYYI